MTTETVHHMPQGRAHAQKQRSCLPRLRRHTAKQTERAPAKHASTTAPHKQPPFLRNFRQFLMALQANLNILVGHLRVLPCLTLTFFSGFTSLVSYTGCFSLTKLKIPFQGPSSNADFVAAWIPLWLLKILTIFNPEPNSVSFVRGLSTSFQAEALSGYASLPSSDFFFCLLLPLRAHFLLLSGFIIIIKFLREMALPASQPLMKFYHHLYWQVRPLGLWLCHNTSFYYSASIITYVSYLVHYTRDLIFHQRKHNAVVKILHGFWTQISWVQNPVQFNHSVVSSSLWPMDCSMPGFPVHHQLLKLAQTPVHRVGDAIQPPHPLLFPTPPAFNLSQHQCLFQGVSSLH